MQVIEAIELKEGTELQVFAKKGISVCISPLISVFINQLPSKSVLPPLIKYPLSLHSIKS